MVRRIVRRFTACAFVAMMARSVAASAQSVDPGQIAQAREQYQAGVLSGQRSDWAAARTAFERAYALYPQPLTLLNLATAQVQTGQLLEGAESYRRFVRDATSDPALGYRAAAEDTLASLERRVPHATLTVRALDAGDTLRLDDTTVPREALGSARPLDPGTHTLMLLRAGTVVARASFSLHEGESRAVVLDAPGSRHVVTASLTTRVLRVPSRRPAGALASPWLWTLVGVAVVGTAAGIVAAVAVSSQPYVGNFSDGGSSVR